MMRKGFSPLRMFSRNSPYKKGTQENLEGGGGENQSTLAPSRPPLYPIQTPCDPNKASEAEMPSKQQQNRFGWSDNLPDPPDLAFSSDDTYSNPSCLSSEQRSAYATPLSASNDPDPGIPALDNNPSGNVARSLRYNQHSSALSSSLPLKSTAPHFELEEDPTFWKEHNVQVLLRMRPLNNAELSTQGHSRCIRQDSAHALTWIGHPETRFTFDFVASEATTQEKLFKIAGLPMVENCLEGYNSCMFAYGQTGSGKTHTMLGDLEGTDCCISDNRGMTPRVFEYLFARIEQEEELRRHENIKYACKCSFLEIYNEQITDLLEPSITNLQMREDAKKGVYVENLTEIEVKNVHDVIRGLLQGAANRRVAATNMNRESSRSHSVFTCVIESKWESHGVTSNRFGRLNLVDLAGSERQKSSGAEGERLKEAANINKSLSTLGLVIMSLVDIANGKQRHVPYRDSKLTFLLHDSLGGNSKTTIIANISPSKCCALETLSTLKFAQRAKFIRNNAVVNEDASGDVMALRMQIHQLKEEVNHLRNQSFANGGRLELVQGGYPNHDSGVLNSYLMSNMDHPYSLEAWDSLKALASPTFSSKKKKELEIALVGSLRREKILETMSGQTASEIEHLKRLVKQREEDSQCGKMMLRFREDKIKRLESMIGGFISAESYLLEENNALQEEVQVLRSRLERNPEVTRFAMENIRLMEKLRRFQDFYEGGEREALTEEIAILRDQLLEALDWKLMNEQDASLSSSQNGDISALMEENQLLQRQVEKSHREADALRHNLSSCLEMREKLERRVDELEAQRDGLNRGAVTEESNSVHSQLEKQIETVEVVASMQAELMAMREAVAATTEAESEARGRMSALTTEIESLKMELQQLQGENSVLCSAFEKAVQEKESQIRITIENKDAEMKGLLQCLSETFCLDQREMLDLATLEASREEVLQSVKAHLRLLQEKEGGLLDSMQQILDGKIQGVEAAMERMSAFVEELDKVKMGFEEKLHGIGLTLLGHTQDCCIYLDECEKKVAEWICMAKTRLDKTEVDITEIGVGVASLQNGTREQGLELDAGNAIQALLSHLEDCCVRLEEEEDGMLQRLQGTKRCIENADALLEQTLASASRIEDEGKKLEEEIMRINDDKAQVVDGEQTTEKKEMGEEGLEMISLVKLFLGKLQEARSLEERLSDGRLKLVQSENKVRAIERLVEGLASARDGWKSREKKMHEYSGGLLSALESSRAGMALLQEERRSLELSLELNARNEEGLLKEVAEIEVKLEIAAERRIKDATQTLFVKQNDGNSNPPSCSMMELLRGEEERVALTSSLEGIRSELAFLRLERDTLMKEAQRNSTALLFAQVDLESATAEVEEAEAESEEIKKEEGLLLDTEAEANSQLQLLHRELEKAKEELASIEETAESVDTEIKKLKEAMLHLHEPTADLCNSARSL